MVFSTLPLRFPQMAELLGSRFTESAFERSFYRRDLAVVPAYLGRLLGQTLPDAVARPESVDEVAGLVRMAVAEHLPVVPRAAATTTYWNSVPVRGGLVLDLTGMSAISEVDVVTPAVTVGPGVRWMELERALEGRGYATLAYPTSAPSATVGGWLSMEGYGIGSLAHGPVAQHVLRVQAVLPDGQVVDTSSDQGFNPALFAGAEGTLGVITEITLRVRPRPEREAHFLLACPDLAAVQGVIATLSGGQPRPFYMHFATASYQAQMAAAGFAPPHPGHTLAVSYQGTAGEIEAALLLVAATVAKWGGQCLDESLAAKEWDERFMALRLKRAGPSVLGAEAWLPAGRIAAYEAGVARMAMSQRISVATYGTIVAPGWATVMSLYPCDETRPVDYLLALSLTRQLYQIAFRHGGRPYGVGLWNTSYLRRTSSPGELAELRQRKAGLDPSNLMNPGKRYAPPLLLHPAIFAPGMATLALLRRVAGGRA
jgi:FAD/FMN-containing dehydrogenase